MKKDKYFTIDDKYVRMNFTEPNNKPYPPTLNPILSSNDLINFVNSKNYTFYNIDKNGKSGETYEFKSDETFTFKGEEGKWRAFNNYTLDLTYSNN